MSWSVSPSSATLSRTAIAPSTLLWFVIATWVSPRSMAFSMNRSSVSSESRLKRVWMWKSANAFGVRGLSGGRSLVAEARAELGRRNGDRHIGGLMRG